MGDEQLVKGNILNSLKCAVLNNGNLQISNDVCDNKETCYVWNKTALDKFAKNLSFAVTEDREKKTADKYEIHQLEESIENIEWMIKKIEEKINIYCSTAKQWHKIQNYDGFLSQRSVGVQYPPRKRYRLDKRS